MGMTATNRGFCKGVIVDGDKGPITLSASPSQDLLVIAITHEPNAWNEAVGMAGIRAGVDEMNTVFSGVGTLQQHASVVTSLFHNVPEAVLSAVLAAAGQADKLVGQKITFQNALPALVSIATAAGVNTGTVGQASAVAQAVQSVVASLKK